MPRRGPNFLPKLSHYRPRQCGRVRIPGRPDVYLGAKGSWPLDRKQPPKAIVEEYQREIARWLATRADGRDGSPPPTPGLTITELAVAYRKHCLKWYTKRGRPTSQVKLIGNAVREVRQLYGSTPAAEFRAADLRAVRDRMERSGRYNRETVNYHLGRIRRMFRWAVEQELIAEDVWLRLKTVSGLKKGRTTAREPGKVKPVAWSAVEAVLPHLPDVVAAIVQAQWLAGMRPEEVCYMRPADIEPVPGGLLRYTVRDDANKLSHLGIPRIVYLGPQCQRVLKPWLDRARLKGPDEWVFPKQIGKGVMTPNNYWLILTQACERHGMERFTPYQLRHARGTEARKRYGLDGVQAILGHQEAETSEGYSWTALEELAQRIARETG